MKYIKFLLCLLCFAGPLHAQWNSAMLETPIPLSDSSVPSIGLTLNYHAFFKNNEYFDSIAQGYTLFGTQAEPSLYYMPNTHVRVQAGVYMRKDYGNEHFTRVEPIFSVKLQQNGYALIAGRLEGTVQHQLCEPMYNYERYILQPIENGIQIKTDHARFWSDTWLNWEVQEYLHSNYQEQLCVGHSSQLTLLEKPGRWRLRIPLQLIVTHKGGQIDIDTTSLRTLFNAATGIQFSYQPAGKHSWIKQIQTEDYLVVYKDISPSKRQTYKQGQGLFLNASLLTRWDVGCSLGYWSAWHYIASRGGDLFQSIASPYGGRTYVDPRRELLFMRLFFQKKLYGALRMDLRLEPYYDIPHQYLAYSYSLYLTLQQDFNFLNLNKRKQTE